METTRAQSGATANPSNRVPAEREFDYAMIHVYEAAGKETGYWAHRFLQMVRRRGGVETARRLLAAPGISDGFQTLRRANRLDLSVENQVLRPKFAELFSEEELKIARSRLAEYGYRGSTH